MTKCTYCGKEYPDNITLCPVDMQPVTPDGVPPDAAADTYQSVPERHRAGVKSLRELALKDMRKGAIWFVSGVTITWLTYSMAASKSEGGYYLICWGPVIFGAVRFVQGWFLLNSTNYRPAPMNTPGIDFSTTEVAPLTSAGWTCRNCGEACESILTSCWRCSRPRQPDEPEVSPSNVAESHSVSSTDPLTNNRAAQAALKVAVCAGDPERIRQLVRLYPELLNGTDEQGECPLHWAAEAQSLTSVACLMDLGADPARKDQHGYTPEQVACLVGEFRMGAYTEACRQIVERLKRGPGL